MIWTRWGAKREEFWLGYKLHVTETCDDPPACTCPAAQVATARAGGHGREHDKGCAKLVFPNLITNVATTDATVTDNQMTGPIHDDLAEKNLAPGTALPRFRGKDAIVAIFSITDCGPCPARPLCTAANRRVLSLPPPDLAEAQAAARTAEKTIPFQADYARRAGVEGTMHQAVSHGARRARYRGLPKTRLDHVYMACALNLLRLEAFWTGTPLDRRRTSHLARLELGLAA